MLKFDFERMFRLRNVEKPYTFLRKCGFTHGVSKKINSGEMKEMKISELYVLCRELNCTPNDLFAYTPGNEPEGHALYGLIKDVQIVDYNKSIRKLSLDQVDELAKFLEEMQKREK